MALFAVIVREGSFTAAARALGITKQSVSERVAKLEAELGVGLLARSTRSMRLTEPGERFHRACAAMVALADEATQEVREAHSEPSGLLRITAPEVLGYALILPAVAELRRRHPGLEFELALDDRRVDLIQGHFDLAVRLGDAPKGFSATKLGEAKLLYVASPKLLETQHPQTLAQLAKLPCVGRARVERWALGRRSVRVEPVVVISSHEGLRHAACLGLGVARAAQALVEEDVRRGRLQELFDGRPALRGPVHVIWRTGAHRSRRMELFIETLARLARDWAPLGGRALARTRNTT